MKYDFQVNTSSTPRTTRKCFKYTNLSQEAQTGIITLDDDPPEILDLLLTYLYTSDYAVLETARGASRYSDCNINLLIHAQVHALADKYLVTELVDRSVTKFKNALEEEYLFTPGLSQFTEVLCVVFKAGQNNEALRKLCLRFATKHYKELIKHWEFQVFCQENGDVAFEILKALAGGWGRTEDTSCPMCGGNVMASSRGTYHCGVCRKSWARNIRT